MNDQLRERLTYRPCVGIMLLNSDGLVWVGRRIAKWNGDHSAAKWQMPQGGIDDGEDPKTAALRELEEETGTSNGEIIGETEGWLTYDLPDELLGQALKGKYRGQIQKWFAVRFLGQDSEININPTDHKPEFDAWEWRKMEELPDLIVPFKRQIYEQVVAEFSHLAPR